MKKPDRCSVKISTLHIWPITSSSCSLTCFSLLHTSCNLVVSSKDWRKFRFSGIIHQESSQLLLMSRFISGLRCGQPDPSITKEILYIPVNWVILLTVDNHCLHPLVVTEWWFSILSLFLHLLAIILCGRTYQLFGTLKYSSYKKKKQHKCLFPFVYQFPEYWIAPATFRNDQWGLSVWCWILLETLGFYPFRMCQSIVLITLSDAQISHLWSMGAPSSCLWSPFNIIPLVFSDKVRYQAPGLNLEPTVPTGTSGSFPYM